ncbi:MAG: squalene/phytoene synthase family protein [Rhodospirillales bacterium]|nr:squalene/phytoene synthase family protein [Rhodospirillales bacterium]
MTHLSYPARHLRRFDNDRFIFSLFAPPAVRDGLHALYAFNVEVARIRETVSESLLGRIRLQWWRDTLDAIAEGREPDHPIATPLATTIKGFGLPRHSFDRLLDTREIDMEDRSPKDMAALIDYADGVSATLASLSLRILGVGGGDGATEQEPVQQTAREVAIAWVLVGLLRALPFHARARRSYLPVALCRDAGLDVMELFERGPTVGLNSVVQGIAAVAQQHVYAARQKRREVPKEALPQLLPATMADVYLRRLARVDYDPFHPLVQHKGAGPLLRTAYGALRRRY